MSAPVHNNSRALSRLSADFETMKVRNQILEGQLLSLRLKISTLESKSTVNFQLANHANEQWATPEKCAESSLSVDLYFSTRSSEQCCDEAMIHQILAASRGPKVVNQTLLRTRQRYPKDFQEIAELSIELARKADEHWKAAAISEYLSNLEGVRHTSTPSGSMPPGGLPIASVISIGSMARVR